MHITSPVNGQTILTHLAEFPHAHLDIGCGDGRAALQLARSRPDTLVVGSDICLANLVRQTRKAPRNLVFIEVDATQPPPELIGRFDSISIHLPFGSLLRGLMSGDHQRLSDILSPVKPGGSVELLINESAVRSTFGNVESMPALAAIANHLTHATVTTKTNVELRHCPSRWAKRIGYGKPSICWHIIGKAGKPGANAPGSANQIRASIQPMIESRPSSLTISSKRSCRPPSIMFSVLSSELTASINCTLPAGDVAVSCVP